MAEASSSVEIRPLSQDIASAEALRRVELPLRDLEYNVEAYLLDNGAKLDTGTRRFLAQLRDALGGLSVAAGHLGQTSPPRR